MRKKKRELTEEQKAAARAQAEEGKRKAQARLRARRRRERQYEKKASKAAFGCGVATHVLRHHIADGDDFFCDACESDLLYGTPLWSCAACDWDACGACYNKANHVDGRGEEGPAAPAVALDPLDPWAIKEEMRLMREERRRRRKEPSTPQIDALSGSLPRLASRHTV